MCVCCDSVENGWKQRLWQDNLWGCRQPSPSVGVRVEWIEHGLVAKLCCLIDIKTRQGWFQLRWGLV